MYKNFEEAVQFAAKYAYEMTDWDAAPQWQKDFYVRGVRFILGYGGEVTPEMVHENWRQHRENLGWVYDTNENAGAKRSPAMLPWNELPDNIRLQDALFIEAVVTALDEFLPKFDVEEE